MAIDKETQKNVQEIWEKTKGALKKFGQETAVLAKKGEVEIVKATKAGKMQIDILTQKNKRDQLFRQIGKKAHELFTDGKTDISPLGPLFKEIDKANGKITDLEQVIKTIYKKAPETQAKKPAKK